MTDVICECCERERQPDEEGWVISSEGADLCPGCFKSLADAWQEMIDKLPKRIGLCPEHAPEFYYPLTDGESLTCPQCSATMVVYEQVTTATPAGSIPPTTPTEEGR